MYAPFRAFGSSTDRCLAAFAVLLLLARASPRQACSYGEAKPLNLTVASWGVARVEMLGWGSRESLVINSNTLMRSRGEILMAL